MMEIRNEDSSAVWGKLDRPEPPPGALEYQWPARPIATLLRRETWWIPKDRSSALDLAERIDFLPTQRFLDDIEPPPPGLALRRLRAKHFENEPPSGIFGRGALPTWPPSTFPLITETLADAPKLVTATGTVEAAIASLARLPDGSGVTLHSRGGAVFRYFELAATITEKRLGVHVPAVATGAAVLLVAASPRATMEKGAVLGFTQMAIGCAGGLEQYIQIADLLDSLTDAFARFIARGPVAPKTVRAWMEEGRWLTAEEALSAGLVAEVFDDPETRFENGASP